MKVESQFGSYIYIVADGNKKIILNNVTYSAVLLCRYTIKDLCADNYKKLEKEIFNYCDMDNRGAYILRNKMDSERVCEMIYEYITQQEVINGLAGGRIEVNAV